MLALSSRFEFDYLHESSIFITFIVSNIVQNTYFLLPSHGHCNMMFYSGYLDSYFPDSNRRGGAMPKLVREKQISIES